MYYANKLHGFTADSKEWRFKCFHAMSKQVAAQALADLREHFNASKHSYKISFTFNIPREKFYNKQGLISSRTADLSNVEKALVDVIFLPANFGNNPPYNCEQLNIDDKYVTEMSSRKVAVDADYSIDITIEIV